MALLFALTLAVGSVGTAQAQTGPFGADQNLAWWFKGDQAVFENGNNCTTAAGDGDSAECWQNQSGSADAIQTNSGGPARGGKIPTYRTGDLKGVLEFKQGDRGPSRFYDVGSGFSGGNTIVIVSKITNTSVDDQNALNIGGGTRVVKYRPGGPGISVSNGAGSISTSVITTDEYNIISSVSGADGLDLVVNGDQKATGPGSSDNANSGVLGSDGGNFIGRIGEVVFYDEASNTQRRIAENYLSEKYGIALDDHDYYIFGSGHPKDIAGIGRTSASDRLRQNSSDILQVNDSGGLSADSAFVLFGHDGESTSFETNERPNGKTTAQKIGREWRFDVTGATNETETISEISLAEADVNGLGGRPNDHNDYALFVDKDGDFTSGATHYDLELSGGRYRASDVTIPDGAYVTIASVKRTITFVRAFSSDFENRNNGDPYQPSLSVEVNYSNATDLSVDYGVSAGENSPTDGADYNTAGSTFTLTAGTTSCDFNTANTAENCYGSSVPLTILDDAQSETNTEEVDVSLSNLGSNLAAGNTTTFSFGILDNENGKKAAYNEPPSNESYNPTSVNEGNTTLTYEVTLPDGFSGSPTDVTYEVTGGSATAGSDFELVSGEEGTKKTPTKGVVTIGPSSQIAQFQIDILDDNEFEGDESFTLELTRSEGGTLDPSGTLSIPVTIQEDESKPDVFFSSGSFSGSEGDDAVVTVELSETVSTDVTVTFEDRTGGGEPTAGSCSGNDYRDFTDNTTTIPSNTLTADFGFSTCDDSDEEGSETVKVGIKSASGANPSGTTEADYTIIDNDVLGSVGPGGVGAKAQLKVWLKGDGVDGVSDGANLQPWPDSSGNGNGTKEEQTGTTGGPPPSDPIYNNKPEYRTGTGNQPNGSPKVAFNVNGDESNEYYGLSYSSTTQLPGSDNTVIAVSRVTDGGADETIFDVKDSGGTTVRDLRYNSSGGVSATNGSGTAEINSGVSPTNFSVITSVLSGASLDLFVNEGVSSNASASATTGAVARLGTDGEGGGNNLEGDIAEFIVFNKAVNTAQRTIIANYLAAKYNISLGSLGGNTNDIYAGDQGGNGDYDVGVIGIGKEGGSDTKFAHTRAQDQGITLNSSSLSDGNYVFIGQKASGSRASGANFTSGNGIAVRTNRTFYANTQGTPTFDVAIDTTLLKGVRLSGAASGYKLVYRSGTSGNWSEAGGTASISSGELTFSGVSGLSDFSGQIAVGTTDPINSPLLNSYARTVTGNAGTDGTDKGWRMIGVPVAGATIDDLQPPISPRDDGFTTHSVNMDYQWDLKNNEGSWDELQSGDKIPNGRGFILYLYDDQYYPVDTDIPLDVEVNNGPPGNQNVIVGDTFPLNTDSTWHLLANPYEQSYDLQSLNIGATSEGGIDGDEDGDFDFQRTVKVWGPNRGYVDRNTGAPVGDTTKLAPWQGFFVERNDFDSNAADALTFGKSGRTTGGDLIGSKAEETSYRKVDLDLIAYGAAGQVENRDRQAVGLLFNQVSERDWDAYDATKLQPLAWSYVALGAVGEKRGEEVLQSQTSLPYQLEDDIEIPVELQVANLDPAELELTSSAWANVPDEWAVTLVDTKGTADSTDDEEIEWGSDASYSFTLNSPKQKTSAKQTSTVEADQAEKRVGPPTVQPLSRKKEVTRSKTDGKAKSGSDTTRFVIRIQSEQALPVEMADVTARTEDKSVLLKWSTASETNNAGFYVEHQALPAGDSTVNADAWSRKGFVEGSGTTNEPQEYEHRLADLDYGRHVFRLRQVDTDGEATTTEVVRANVRLDEGHAVGQPYPNPTRQRATLKVTVREDQRVRVEMYDILGRRVRTLHDDKLEEQNTHQMGLPVKNLASGAYFLRVRGDDFTETRRLTVVQ